MILFLCKQKTAYERRISDGSSDVCSSDLGATVRTDGDIVDQRRRGKPVELVVEHRGIEADDRRRDFQPGFIGIDLRSEERRVGKEWVSTCRYRRSAVH